MIRRMGWMAGLALAVLAVPAMAQQGPGRGGMGMRGMMAPTLDDLKAALSLEEAQQAKVKTLLEKLAADTKAPRETMMENMQMVRDGAVTREAVQAQNQEAMGKIREANDKFYEELKSILTPDQQKALETWREQQRQRMQRPPGR